LLIFQADKQAKNAATAVASPIFGTIFRGINERRTEAGDSAEDFGELRPRKAGDTEASH
jgi:hypothetical protein